MTARRLALLALLPGLLAFAPAPLPRKQRAAELDLTGTWECVRWEDEGRSRPDAVQGWRAEATRETIDFVSGDGKERRSFTMRLYPKLNPPAIEGAETDSPKAMYYGSYRLRDGELTMIVVKGGTFARRPQNFDAKVEHRFVFRRMTK